MTAAWVWAWAAKLARAVASSCLRAPASRFYIPRAISVFGLVATAVSLLDALVQIGAPAVGGNLAYSGALLLLAEILTGSWLLFAGAGPRRASLPDVRDGPA